MSDYPKHTARGVGEPYFIVSGGPFASSQIMGWHITNERRLTVGVACDATFVERVNKLNELAWLLGRADAEYHLRERRDDGYMALPDTEWARLRDLLKELS